jgi:dTMP kinase
MYGLFTVLYGINNLGKSTQAKLLVERMNAEGYKAEYLKYPIYDLEPSGPLINDYLRNSNPLKFTPRGIQLLYVLNRTQFEPVLKAKLEAGIHIVSEDYVGTGIAWGKGGGVDEPFLKDLNVHLIKEDMAFLFDGKRFTEATESGHTHETNDELTEKVRLAHLELGSEFGWKKIDANRSIEDIHEQIWGVVHKNL